MQPLARRIRVHAFPKGICPKVNVIAQLEYELAYYDSAVHLFNHYTTKTPPRNTEVNIFIYDEMSKGVKINTRKSRKINRKYKITSIEYILIK